MHNVIWSTAKYESAAASPPFQDVVFAFVNTDRDSDHPAGGAEVTTFDIDIDSGGGNLFGIEPDRIYNTKNIAAYTGQDPGRRDTWLWGAAGRTGTDLLANGVTVSMNMVPSAAAGWLSNPFEALYLKLYDVTPPPTPGFPLPEGDYVIGTAVRFDWSEVVGEDDNVVKYLIDAGTVPGGNDLAAGLEVETNQAIVSGAYGQTVYVTVRVVSAAGVVSIGATGSAGTPAVLLAPLGDEDGDGMSNGAEDGAGTGPLDGGEIFELSQIQFGGGGAALNLLRSSGVVISLSAVRIYLAGLRSTIQ
ncbi:MAG: hypothetical protein ACI9UA_003774 [Pseudoalteromonas tetraodonis]